MKSQEYLADQECRADFVVLLDSRDGQLSACGLSRVLGFDEATTKKGSAAGFSQQEMNEYLRTAKTSDAVFSLEWINPPAKMNNLLAGVPVIQAQGHACLSRPCLRGSRPERYLCIFGG